MKKAIALCGGGSRGSYHIGAWRALRELGEDFDIITGTSIGALNGAFMVQDDYDTAAKLWQELSIDRVMKDGINLDISIESLYNQKASLRPFLRHYISQKGADIGPFLQILEHYCDPERFFASPKDFGLVTVEFPSLLPYEVVKAQMNEQNVRQWLLASASCFPAFPLCRHEGKSFMDGGYYDNLPISLALKLGAEQVLALDLHTEASHPQYMNKPFIAYSKLCRELGGFLIFEQDIMQRNSLLGYYDMLKLYGRLEGFRYNFRIGSDRGFLEQCSRRLLLMLNEAESFVANKNQSALMNKIAGIISQTPLTDVLTEYTDGKSLNAIQYLLRAAENAGEAVGLEFNRVYTVEQFNRAVFAAFDDGRQYNYKALFRALTDFRKPSLIRQAFSQIDMQYLVGCLYHYAKEETADNNSFEQDFRWSALFVPKAALAAWYMLFCEEYMQNNTN